MPTDFTNVFAVLLAARVRFVVVGGLAVLLHGIDRLAAGPAGAAMAALLGAGLRPVAPVDAMQFADPVVRGAWHRAGGMDVFSLWDPAHRRPTVDVFAEPPIPFEAPWRDSVEVALGNLRVRLASIAHLIRMKDAVGPPKDLDDVVRLRRWAFLQRTPEQRLAWLVAALELAYPSGALVPGEPATADEAAT